MPPRTTNISFVSLEQAQRCAVLLFASNTPFILWGGVGVGKSSVVKQLTDRLKWTLYDVRGSDKDASDIAGIPFPDNDKVRYLMPNLIPWASAVGDAKAVLFLDEIDRSDKPVQNVLIQLILDRQVNGNRLGNNVRVCAAGNGSSDTGTTEINDALATRCVHLYVEAGSDSAIDSWDKWAEGNGISPMLRAFAKFSPEVRKGNGQDKLIEYARPTPRTFDMADRVLQFADQAKFKTADLRRPLVCGAVGFEAGMKLLGFSELYREAPSIEEILANPDTCKVPEDAGILHALSLTLSDKCKGDDVEARARTLAVATYVNRFPAEQSAFAFNRIERINPWIVTQSVWNKRVR